MPVPTRYLVYVNGVPVTLCTVTEAKAMQFKADKIHLFAPYIGKKKMIVQYLDKLDKNRDIKAVVLYDFDLSRLWNDFQSCFNWIEAAGAYVVNAEKKLLVFYRRGMWDMPKGKIDPGETPEQAALREVEEETGLQQLSLGPLLLNTYHTYTQKEERYLKKTWWYRMETTQTNVTPQTEEDIERIEWVEPEAWLQSGVEVYGSIRDVIEKGLRV